jgi:hypothetical protein
MARFTRGALTMESLRYDFFGCVFLPY